MLGKFSKAEFKNVLDAQHEVREAVQALQDKLAGEVKVRSEDEMTAHTDTLEQLHEKAAERCADFASFMATFAEEQQDQYDEKSEKWQEGDRAQQVGSWIDALTELAEYEFPDFEIDEKNVAWRPVEADDEVEEDAAETEGLPTEFPAFVNFSYAIDIDDLTNFADSLENLPESANDM